MRALARSIPTLAHRDNDTEAALILKGDLVECMIAQFDRFPFLGDAFDVAHRRDLRRTCCSVACCSDLVYKSCLGAPYSKANVEIERNTLPEPVKDYMTRSSNFFATVLVALLHCEGHACAPLPL